MDLISCEYSKVETNHALLNKSDCSWIIGSEFCIKMKMGDSKKSLQSQAISTFQEIKKYLAHAYRNYRSFTSPRNCKNLKINVCRACTGLVLKVYGIALSIKLED